VTQTCRKAPAAPKLLLAYQSQIFSVWVERFSLMATALVMRFPDKASELFAYQASIIRVECNTRKNVG